MFRLSTAIGLAVLGAIPLAHAEPIGHAGSAPYRLILRDDADYRLSAAADSRPVDRVPDTLVGLQGDRPFRREVHQAALREGLDPALVHALIAVESRHNPNAVSPKGAVGLMQVLPATAARFGSNGKLLSVEENLRIGTRYFRMLLDRFDQRVDLALAAYNAGEGAVIRHGNRIPAYAETRKYVPAVLAHYESWRH